MRSQNILINFIAKNINCSRYYCHHHAWRALHDKMKNEKVTLTQSMQTLLFFTNAHRKKMTGTLQCFSILIVSFGHTIVWFLLFIGSFKQAKIPSLLALKILILHFSSQNAPLFLKKWLHFDIVAIERTLIVSFFNPAALIISWRVLILSQKISALWHHLGLSHMASMSCNKIILLFSAAPGAGNYTCGEMT